MERSPHQQQSRSGRWVWEEVREAGKVEKGKGKDEREGEGEGVGDVCGLAAGRAGCGGIVGAGGYGG